MIKTILVPMSGSTSDDSVFATALEVPRPMDAHLDFYHVRLSASEAAVRSVHFQFCPAAVLGSALTQLESREDAFSCATVERFEAFCDIHAIPRLDRPAGGTGLSARRIEETMVTCRYVKSCSAASPSPSSSKPKCPCC